MDKFGQCDNPEVSTGEWQAFIDMLGDFFFVIGMKGEIVKANPVAERKLGFALGELEGKIIFDIYPPDRRGEAEDLYSKIIAGERHICDIPFMAKDGRLIAVETRVSMGRWGDGREVIFSVSRDVSAGKAIEMELRLAFEKFSAILNFVPAYIWSGIAEGVGNFRYVFQSPAIAEITGRPPVSFEGRIEQWLAIIHHDDREEIARAYRLIMRGESSREVATYRVLRPDAEVRWVRESINAAPIGEGRIRLDGVVTDVTERRLAVEALERSETRLKGILSSMSDMVFAFDNETRFTFFHTPNEQLLYKKPEEFIGKMHDEVMPPELHDRFQKAFEEVMAGRDTGYEYWLNINGDNKCFAVKLSPIRRGDIFEGAVGVVREITAEKRLEEKLRHSERRYRELFTVFQDGSTWVDMDGRIREANKAFQDIVGYSQDELRGMTIWDITPERWHDVDLTHIREQVITRGYSDCYKKEYRAKNGAIVPVKVRRYLIRNEKNEPEGMWVIVSDEKTGPDSSP